MEMGMEIEMGVRMRIRTGSFEKVNICRYVRR